jgi:predicted pyridoxine 5'-phosphate oxidase superfamily flavin-nucleotide-binding protein
MGKTFASLNETLAGFVERQSVFFVATAPAGGDGHVNVSPKGLAGTLRVVDHSTVAYIDVVGSGVETIAHLRENGRITLMFCAFDGPPLIARCYGTGEVLLPGEARFDELRPGFPDDLRAVRSIIVVHVDEVRTACGYGVPRMPYEGDRDDQVRWAERKGPDGIVRYVAEKNRRSLDDLPGLPGLV